MSSSSKISSRNTPVFGAVKDLENTPTYPLASKRPVIDQPVAMAKTVAS